MPDQSTGDFTQTVIGDTTPVSTSSSHPSKFESLEGRFLPGTLLNGRYRIIALLGKGGMGEVYRAADLTLGQSVALKFLPQLATSDPRWLKRFHSEVRIARQVSHPNVCRVYDIGENLSSLLRRIGRLPSDKAIEISRKVCAGLAAVASELNASEIRQGTPAYMASEQLKGTEATHFSDIYSLGLVLTTFTAAAFWLSLGGQSILRNDPK